LLYLLWISGATSFWVGALLAQINGYPVKIVLSLGAAAVLALGQGAVIWRLRWGRDIIASFILGLLPACFGFFLQSRHWASELFILGFLLTLANFNALLAQRWEQEWKLLITEGTHNFPDGAARGLVFTLVNILIISGLLLIWFFPPAPLPGRGGAWVLATAAVLNQELIKRKYYASYRNSVILAWMSTAFLVGLSLWLLAVVYLRGAS
jgi:hypothetical protein